MALQDVQVTNAGDPIALTPWIFITSPWLTMTPWSCGDSRYWNRSTSMESWSSSISVPREWNPHLSAAGTCFAWKRRWWCGTMKYSYHLVSVVSLWIRHQPKYYIRTFRRRQFFNFPVNSLRQSKSSFQHVQNTTLSIFDPMAYQRLASAKSLRQASAVSVRRFWGVCLQFENDPKWSQMYLGFPFSFPYISMDVLRFSTNLDAVSKCWGLRVTFHLLIFLMIWDWHRDEGIVVLTSSHCETRFIQQLIKNQNLSFFTNLWWVQSFPHIFFHLFPIRQHLHPWAQDVEVSAVFVACSSTMLPPSPGLYLQRLNVPVLLISIRIPCGLMCT